MRPEIKLAPLILGGGQEGGYRAGTENLPAIVGMGVAADLARLEGPAEVARLRELRDRLRPRCAGRLPLLHARTLDDRERDRRRRRDAARRGRAPAPARAALTCGSSCSTSTARC